MLRSSSILKRNAAQLIRKKMFGKKTILIVVLNMQKEY
jgi:hypothetical protein